MMSDMNAGRLAARLTVTGAIVLTALIATAGAAYAHVDVTADKPQAGATDVTVKFSAAAESRTAGVASVRVVLPDGIAPADVTYVSGPDGWALTPTADGYTVGGPALAPGKNLEYQIKIGKLPTDATALPFKTLQNYSDGRVDRWIDLSQNGVQADNPAPSLKLAPADAGSAPAPTAPVTTAASPPSATTTASDSGDDSSNRWWIALVVLVIIGLAGGLFWQRRRAAATPS
jgi:uncharacterized protein YcnI